MSSYRYQSRLVNWALHQVHGVAHQGRVVFRHLKLWAEGGLQSLAYMAAHFWPWVHRLGHTLGSVGGQRSHLPPASASPTQSRTQPLEQPIVRVMQGIQNQIPGVVWDLGAPDSFSSSEPRTPSLLPTQRWRIPTVLGAPSSIAPLESAALLPSQEHSNPRPGLLQILTKQVSTVVSRLGLAMTQSPQPELQQAHPPIKVRAVASLLSSRRLVLVAPDNRILDLLSPWQQWRLQQQINWQVLSARCRQSQAALKTACTALPGAARQLTTRRSWLWLPAAQSVGVVLANCKRWLQPRLQFALHQSKQRLLPTLEGSLARVQPQISARLQVLGRQLRPWWSILTGLLALMPLSGGLNLPARAATPALEASSLSSDSRASASGAQWLGGWQPPASRSVGALTPTQPLAANQAITTGSQPMSAALGITPGQTSSQQTSPLEVNPVYASAVDVDAVFLGYEFHPLEQLLIGLDRGLTWLETQLAHLWQRLWPWLKAWGSKVLF